LDATELQATGFFNNLSESEFKEKLDLNNVCGGVWPQMFQENPKKAITKSYALDQMKELLDTNTLDPGITVEDIDEFIFTHNRDDENRLSLNEFL